MYCIWSHSTSAFEFQEITNGASKFSMGNISHMVAVFLLPTVPLTAHATSVVAVGESSLLQRKYVGVWWCTCFICTRMWMF